MTGFYPDEIGEWPIIIASTELGDMGTGLALGRIDTDDGLGYTTGATPTGAPIYGTRATDSTITLAIQARSEAQRTYLLDVMTAGILWGFWTNPATGRPVDQVVRRWLGEAGIMLKTVRKPRFPEPRADDPRPEGQRFNAELPLLCDVWVTDVGSTLSVGTISVQQSPTTEAGATLGQPAVTVAP